MSAAEKLHDVRVVCERDGLFYHRARVIDVESGGVLAVSEPLNTPAEAIADARSMICENEREVAP